MTTIVSIIFISLLIAHLIYRHYKKDQAMKAMLQKQEDKLRYEAMLTKIGKLEMTAEQAQQKTVDSQPAWAPSFEWYQVVKKIDQTSSEGLQLVTTSLTVHNAKAIASKLVDMGYKVEIHEQADPSVGTRYFDLQISW